MGSPAIEPTYRPLADARSEIRLMELLSTGNGVPECWKLTTVSLDDSPRFTALSYVWGDTNVRDTVMLNGQSTSVTVNLAAALRHVESHWRSSFPGRGSETFWLWVDALCINQGDIGERNHQIPLMQRIFSSAELVISWLGGESGIVTRAFDTLDLVAAEVQALVPQVTDLDSMPDGEHRLVDWMARYPGLCALAVEDWSKNLSSDSISWVAAVAHLFRLPYWKRVWIFQEVVLAKNLLFVSGSHSVPWPSIDYFQAWIRQLRRCSPSRPEFLTYDIWIGIMSDVTLPTSYLQDICWVKSVHMNVPSNKANGWWTSLCGRNLQASDPKDHIYGLLGLTHINVKVDYSAEKSLGDVYAEYAAGWLESWNDNREGNGLWKLGFLCFSGIRMVREYGSHMSFPSWAPHFPFLSRENKGMIMLKGSAGKCVFPHNSEDAVTKGPKLFVSGVQVDRVSGLQEGPSSTGKLLSYIHELVRRRPTYISGIPTLQAVFRVLLYGLIPNNHIPGDPAILHYAWAFIAGIIHDLLDMERPKSEYEDALAKMGLETGSGESFADSLRRTFDPSCERQLLDSAWLRLLMNFESGEIVAHSLLLERYHQVLKELFFSISQTFIETSGGYFGLIAPSTVAIGDVVCVLKGANVPSVLRKTENHYIHVGTCYVWGLQNGEAAELLRTGKSQVEKFEVR